MAINTHPLYNLIFPQSGQIRQASSYGRDPLRGGTWWGLRPQEALKKRILLNPGERHVMADLTGPGLVTQLWMTTLMPFNNHALRSLVLRFYWDNEEFPSVECPFGDFFGAPFGRYVNYISYPMSLTSGAFNCLWPMPYHSAARLEVINEGEQVVEPFFYHVTYAQLAQPLPSSLRFHAAWNRENPTRKDVPFNILEVQGKGHYAGCHLFMQNLERWVPRPVRQIPFPYGMGLGMMEGWESIYVDGEEKPSLIGTGTEDFLGGAWYYAFGGAFHAPYHGCTVCDYFRARIAAYRFDVLAPMPFSQSIQVNIDHGFENRLKCDYTSVAYWYQEEPHRPFSALPPVRARQAASPLGNMLQSGLALGAPILAGAALLWKLSRRFKSGR